MKYLLLTVLLISNSAQANCVRVINLYLASPATGEFIRAKQYIVPDSSDIIQYDFHNISVTFQPINGKCYVKEYTWI